MTKFESMLQIPRAFREALNSRYEVDFGSVSKDTLSEDGTRKILVSFGGQEVECTPFVLDSRVVYQIWHTTARRVVYTYATLL